jgi:hypothetical protein
MPHLPTIFPNYRLGGGSSRCGRSSRGGPRRGLGRGLGGGSGIGPPGSDPSFIIGVALAVTVPRHCLGYGSPICLSFAPRRVWWLRSRIPAVLSHTD